MKLVNLTPHEIVIHILDGDPVVVPPSGTVARVEMGEWHQQPLRVDGVSIPLRLTYPKEMVGLPAEKPGGGVAYIVSQVVAQHVDAGRVDLYTPGELIRDDAGRVIGCRGLTVQ